MSTNRLEAFSDGVIAIIITIMVLELKVPHGDTPEALLPLLPVLFSYLLSFVFIGIYWNNHHHLFQAAERVSGGVLWANLHLLFWLSLVPFVTAWMGENQFAPLPVAAYGAVQLLAAVAFSILVRALIAHHAQDSTLVRALANDTKGKISLAVYAAGTAVAFVQPLAALAAYAAVSIMWLVPERRIEQTINQ